MHAVWLHYWELRVRAAIPNFEWGSLHGYHEVRCVFDFWGFLYRPHIGIATEGHYFEGVH